MLGGVRTRHQRAWPMLGPGSECYLHRTHDDAELNTPTNMLSTGHELAVSRSRFRIKSLKNSRAGQVLLLCVLLLLVLRTPPWFKRCGRPFLGEEWEGSPALNDVLDFVDDGENEALGDDGEILLPRATPLPIGFWANPPQIDHSKFMSRLAMLELQSAEETQDENEEGNTEYSLDTAYDAIQNEPYRKTTSHWPPLIDRVPPITNSQHRHESHEEFTAPIADLYFCGTYPCKVLLPSWSRPLSPSDQRTQLRVLADLAALLNRTLVLPNVGAIEESTTTTGSRAESAMNWYGHGEPPRALLALGTCPRTPLARYYDVTPFLFSNDEGLVSGANSTTVITCRAVPMQPFIEWVKHRPVHPSAQLLAIDGYQKERLYTHETANETAPGSSLDSVNSLLLDVLEGTTYNRGHHKNCLTARVPKLDFKGRSALSISVPHTPTLDYEGRNQTKISLSCLALIDDIENIIKATSALTEPDVLVLEWDLDCNAYSGHPAFPHSDSGTSLSKYSPRLEYLANELIRPYPKPLVLIHSRLELESEKQLRCLQSFSYILDNILSSSSLPSAPAPIAKNLNAEEASEHLDGGPEPIRGSVWLGEGLPTALATLLKSPGISKPSSLDSHIVLLPSNRDTDSVNSSANSGKDLEASVDPGAVCDVVPDLFPNTAIIHLSDAVKDYPRYHFDRQTPVGLLSDVMDDTSMRAILEDIITTKADHVLELNC